MSLLGEFKGCGGSLVIIGWNIDAIDLMDHPSNVEIGLCWYQKMANNKWTYELTDHLMVDLETIIALATIDIYWWIKCLRVTSGRWKSFQQLRWWKLGYFVIHIIGVDYFSKVYLYTYVNDYIWMGVFFCVYILSLVYLLLQLYVYYFISQKNNLYIGVFRVCSECTWF